jgi:tRNA threonylcarbamoyladenosine biosynthesis protein TsaB
VRKVTGSSDTVLGIDTSTTACSAAVLVGGALRASCFEQMARGQAERLNPMIAEVMREAGIGFDALGLIAVTVGPGAFTGLRIGLACARGLSLGTGVPLAGISSFDALAAAVPDDERDGRQLMICVDAKRRDVFIQAYDDLRQPLGAPGALAPEGAAAAFARGRWLIAGDGAAQLRAGLAKAELAQDDAGGKGPGENADARIRFSAAILPPDARYVASIGAAAGADAIPPRPVYIRPPDVRLPNARPPAAGRPDEPGRR